VARVPTSSSPATDELDRLFRRLVLNLAELDPSHVHGPVEVAELYQRLVPYRTHRKDLGIDTHEDYEMTVLRLLAGERGYALVEPAEAREAMAREVAGVNPDTGFFMRFSNARVTLDPEHVRSALGALNPSHVAAEPEPPVAPPAPAGPSDDGGTEWFPEAPADRSDAGGREESEPADAAESGPPFALEEEAASVSPRVASAPCAFCGGDLPVGRAVIFCPHCGQNVGVVHCPACGTELDFGWRYCITCGRQMAALG
jgi:hypothetical protein